MSQNILNGAYIHINFLVMNAFSEKEIFPSLPIHVVNFRARLFIEWYGMVVPE